MHIPFLSYSNYSTDQIAKLIRMACGESGDDKFHCFNQRSVFETGQPEGRPIFFPRHTWK